MTFTILTDSTCDLSQEWSQANNIDILGLTVELNDQSYQTVGDQALDSNLLIEQMKKGAKPKTSQINVGTFEVYFKERAELKEPVLYLAFSSVLSGTYQSAVMAREIVLEEHPEAVIEIIDTLAAAGGEALLVLKADQARKCGKNLQETKTLIEGLAPRITSYFLVDDLYHLMRGGRLSKSSAILGSIASIKPILTIASEGTLVPISKVRGRKKAIRELLALALADVAEEPLVISYTGGSEQAEKLKATIEAESQVSEIILIPIGPVIGAHVGPDTLAIFSIGQYER
ncbi:DegV family protein [Streptococcus parauberis]|uniref:DegV family protein n=1 Tax=Streptococcus parauberis TaxID=1348 RepID=UPI00020CBC8F|nr:DegV family protein [Streptococcus parauberis]AEF25911.1 DegV family protein [Streptococcus parauberis KCTC 11537]EMF48928.1 DegV family protein in cluster with TrmH family tRNA/rRNA methyltransferase [Streptococcus parauberis KRS-02109]UWM87271.1 DegV family protein [Streptococcus parauberis]UWM89244.1 DegV family protein [Streptococcus parauberis]UWM90745.1 DegV family protein [Streptococcus parauberis]